MAITPDDQWRTEGVRRSGGHATALGSPRRARPDRHQIRLRHCAMRRLHGAYRRQAGAFLHAAGGPRCVIAPSTTIEGIGASPVGAKVQKGLARSRSDPVRLLPVSARSCRRQRCSRARPIRMIPTSTRRWREYLPLRHLCTHSRRDQAGCFPTSVVGARHELRRKDSSFGKGFRPSFAPRPADGWSGRRFPAGLPSSRARGERAVQPPDVTDGKFAPNAFIRIDPAGKTTLVMPQVEMGQGIYTAVAMILAEETGRGFFVDRS